MQLTDSINLTQGKDPERKLSPEQMLEVDILLDVLFQRSGYDFSQYARSTLVRRLQNCMLMDDLPHFSHLIPKVLYEKGYMHKLIQELSVSVTEFFRDPAFFQSLEQHVLPVLETFPYFKIWHAGCATGEEVYSLAILLKAHGLYDRAKIYATDFNDRILEKAKVGIFTEETMHQGEQNYNRLTISHDTPFHEYFSTQYHSSKVRMELAQNIVFANHNLVCDGVFGEMQLVLCRNVMIYFDNNLKKRVVDLFDQSLHHSGFLGLGRLENLDYLDTSARWQLLDNAATLYRKVPGPKLGLKT
ncbi:protein-glutamate O-methyltransferase CheR [Pseudoalteromonas sp. R3]|uniref:CheR family methyltransferase n=1 Tax=Pseudoalteromonas sp. R3 TaxID=1709477 RepID=UPI0006B5D661|nr:protein-glutamate O-methyltransferase CheR [Pseudoalteromonas sp. R3]AZZ96317.1 protein-glutamate O-methyltransferase CheR [Pseudoalteromonas sp. R3]